MKSSKPVETATPHRKRWAGSPSMLVASLLLSAPGTIWAAPFDDADEDPYEFTPLVTQRVNQFTSEVELGMRYITDDAFKFGEYNSQNHQGWQVDGNFDIEQRDFEDGTAKYLRAEGNSIGTKSRDVTLEGGQQGDHKFRLYFDGIEKQTHGQFLQPYDNSNPYEQVSTGVTPPFSTEEVKVNREKIGLLFSKKTPSRWTFTAEANQEEKEGTRDYANFRTLYLYPIEYTTSTVNLAADYAAKDYQLQLGYEFSKFENASADVKLNGSSLIAQEPENRFQQVHVNGNYRLTDRTRATGFVAYSVGDQDETILTDASNTSTDAKVKSVIARVGVSSRVTNKLTLNAKYSYQDKDNQTPEYVNTSSRTSQAFDTTWKTLAVNGYYRLPKGSKIGLGYEREDIDRPDQNREETNEDTIWASYKLPMMDRLSGSIKLSRSERDGSAYDPDGISLAVGVGGGGTRISAAGTQNYHDADRDRTKAQVNLQYQLGTTGHIGVMLQKWNDEFPEAVYGLQEVDGEMFTIDFGASPMRTLSYSLYAGVQNFNYDQKGGAGASFPTGSVVAASEWTTDTQSDAFLAGINVNWEVIPNTLALKFGYRYTDTEDIYEQTNGGVASTGTDALPDTDTTIHTVELQGEYFYSKQTTLIARAVYEDYENNNWSYGDTATPAVNNAEIENPYHNAGLIEFGIRYQF
ncbi:MtrB/PioB family decaheme-associated outer membrane protein [Motiliproteus sediminis]|uniref:MtrB/PioB family decaheme-associated outer membrane protein n=1 Tax=Motiliproteus sediminis TaxID=1468178 RepID=UPI001AEF36E0|nr:MtrB/PioB family decaheme-associated outer membrane protein [Motiliproteus sediminis]